MINLTPAAFDNVRGTLYRVSNYALTLEGAQMFQDERSYYQYRAEVEVERAQEATITAVVRVHYDLAEAYLEKVAAIVPALAEAA